MAGSFRRAFLIIAFSFAAIPANMSWATMPVALESAYWRFQEGVANTPVGPADTDVVKDSINHNDLRPPAATDPVAVAPMWSDVVPLTPLKSGATNTGSISFTGQSQVATSLKNIDNGIIAPGAGFTLEAAFQANAVTFPGGPYQSIIVKQGQPADDGVAPKNFIENLPTLTLKVRGDNGKLQFEEFDGAKNLVSVSSQAAIVPNQWYYAAVVNDGTQMQLYLDSNDGNGYQLQSTVGVNGALYQTNKTNGQPDWWGLWAIGRGDFNGSTDWFNGFIDEVRISNSVLSPSQFLFAPNLPGDFNGDGNVDGADYVVWRKTIQSPQGYADWRANFGNPSGAGADIAGSPSVPEATSEMFVLMAIGMATVRRFAVL